MEDNVDGFGLTDEELVEEDDTVSGFDAGVLDTVAFGVVCAWDDVFAVRFSTTYNTITKRKIFTSRPKFESAALTGNAHYGTAHMSFFSLTKLEFSIVYCHNISMRVK